MSTDVPGSSSYRSRESQERLPQREDKLGRYTIVRCLGRGGMGLVYLARDPDLRRDIAIKTLPYELTRDPAVLARFQREARILASLNDPGLVTIFSVESDQGIPFLTMEFVPGRALSKLIVPEGLPLATVLQLGISMASALDAAHRHGVIHRDIKPGNIMVLDDQRIKICDFGISQRRFSGNSSDEQATESQILTAMGQVAGTPYYMAPEILQGQPADPQSDIFSLGVVLWEMISGQRPFPGKTPAVVLSAILRDPPVGLSSRRDLPSDFVMVLVDCLQKDREKRPSTASELRRRLERIQMGQHSVGSSPTGLAAAATGDEIRWVAVLPFVELPASNEQDCIADGIAETLNTDLAKLTSLKVVSRTSVMPYRGTQKTVREVAQELGVDAIVEGSVRRVGGRIRVSAQLTRASNSELLWAERYDRDLEDVLTLQDDLARSIARGVGARLVETPRTTVSNRHKVDPEVFLLVSRGRQLWNRRTEAAYRTASEFFQQAIDRDPTYSPALLGLAETLGLLSNHGYLRRDEVSKRLRAATEGALKLDPHSADAHRLRAFEYWQFDFAWQAAIAEYELALQLDPSSWLTTYWYGAYLGVIGQFDRAYSLLAQAAELDPLSLLVPAVQGWVLLFERRIDEAIVALRPLVALNANHLLSHWFLGEALIEAGEWGEGIANLERATQLADRSSRMLGYLGYAYGRAGRHDHALALLNELKTRQNTSYVPPYFLALIHSGLNHPDEAIEQLEHAWEIKDTMIRDLKADPHWDQLRDYPRFKRLFAQLDFPG